MASTDTDLETTPRCVAGRMSWKRVNTSLVVQSNMVLSSRNLIRRAGDDDRDVVRPAPFVGESDQNVARGLGIARLDHHALNLIVFHVVDETSQHSKMRSLGSIVRHPMSG